MSEDPEFLNLSAAFKRFRERMSPEVKQALFTIMDAIFDGAPIKDDIGGPHAEEWLKQRERIQRAERGVKTRRKNQEKVGVGEKSRPTKGRTERRCSSSTTRAGHRQYCLKLDGHRGEHSNGFYEWRRKLSPRAKPAPPKPKPKSRSIRIPGKRCQARYELERCTLEQHHKIPHSSPSHTWVIKKDRKK